MITWNEFAQLNPALAAAGRAQLYWLPIGLGFLATIRPDGGPRVHPVCPVISDAGLHVVVIRGPKQEDLRRDGRYALHSETCPPPREDDGFAIIGRAWEVTDPSVREVVRAQVLAERDGKVWPSFDADALFELRIERCLLTLTQPGGTFPNGPTSWHAPLTCSGPAGPGTSPPDPDPAARRAGERHRAQRLIGRDGIQHITGSSVSLTDAGQLVQSRTHRAYSP